MTYLAKPRLHHPSLPTNALGFTRRDYEGPVSTLCAGCGHDSISAAIIQAFFELAVPPHHVAKLSGIGCSSKTPTYFLGQSHGFNSVHGRMPSVLTGANLANRDLIYLGVSGDGDSASIGLGQFAHAMRRGVNMLYVVENNGVYGLTKGQFSATADRGSKSKKGVTNEDSPIDLVQLAIVLGASFVARGFSGDKEQLVPLIKAAIEHRGAALIDVVSPCVAFNNHSGSTRSYDYVRAHNDAVNRLDFMPLRAPIEAAVAPGELQQVALHDGTTLSLRRLHAEYDPTDKVGAMSYLEAHRARGEVVTGLLYLQPDSGDLHDAQHTVATPLNALSDARWCPAPQRSRGSTRHCAERSRRPLHAGSTGQGPRGGRAAVPRRTRRRAAPQAAPGRHHDHAVVRQRQRELRAGRQRPVDGGRDDEQLAHVGLQRVLHQLAEIRRLLHRRRQPRGARGKELDRLRPQRDLDLAVGLAAMRQPQRHRAEPSRRRASRRGCPASRARGWRRP